MVKMKRAFAAPVLALALMAGPVAEACTRAVYLGPEDREGEMRIWHDRSYQIMTNEPTYDRQLAVLEYWQHVNPREFLPGTVRASDRFCGLISTSIRSRKARIPALRRPRYSA